MIISVMSFTENGIRLSEKIAKEIDDVEVYLFTKCSNSLKDGKIHTAVFVKKSIGEWAKEQMEEKNTLLFIGACGIAVRAIAPCLIDKLTDSPVLVMDEEGTHVIPILSGHVGGANEIALRLAEKTGAIPVITTATDINRTFAVDLFAKKNGLFIVNKEGIAKVSSKVLAGEDITISVESGHLYEGERLPSCLQVITYPPMQQVDIVITTEDKVFDAAILLKPREYVIGMGCRKGKEADRIEDLIKRSMCEIGIMPMQILALSSIEQKGKELGFLAWSRKTNIPFITYTAKELQELSGNYHESAFVKEQVGVDNVCERAAIKACEQGGKLVYEKHAEDGMTIAIAKREWSVVFDEA